MSSPVIWIVIPLISAAIIWMFRRNQKLSTAVGTAVCVILAILAFVLPIGDVIEIGALKIEIQSMLIVFGRRFILTAADNNLLAFIYTASAFWFAGTWVLKVHHSFISLGLAVIALLLAALSVEPFLYSALLFELAVLFSIPIFVKPGSQVGQGTLRYLIFQSLGMPFILLAGWFLGGTGASLSDPLYLNRAIILLGLGFAFWLAVFPFYSWIPLLTEEVNPYVSGFILAMFPAMIIFILLDFINGIIWIRDSDLFFTALQISGVVMIFTGGLWSTFQKNASRLFGYAVIIETGFSLLAISLNNGDGLNYTTMILMPRIISLAVWALAMAFISSRGVGLDYDSLEGIFHRSKVSVLAMLLSIFSLAGLPLLASFSLRYYLVQGIVQKNPGLIVWIILGISGFLLGALRLTSIALRKIKSPEFSGLQRITAFLLLTGILLLFIMGIAPKVFLSGMSDILLAYPNLP